MTHAEHTVESAAQASTAPVVVYDDASVDFLFRVVEAVAFGRPVKDVFPADKSSASVTPLQD